MAREYPLEVHELHDHDGGGTCGYYSKGHHDKAAFAAEAERLFAHEGLLAGVDHGERRWEICAGPDGWIRCLNPPLKGKRGVFPVTIVQW
jgi:hypothetical protein